MTPSPRVATELDAVRISNLIFGLRSQCLTPLSGLRAALSFESISEQAIQKYVSSNNFTYLVVEAGSELMGAAALRDNSHIHHLFVALAHQRKGLGRRLWLQMRDAALQTGNPGLFTVNSSLNAVAVYQRFGFVATGPKVEMRGISFVPMQLLIGQHKELASTSGDLC